jgi:hypothetical protein
MSTRLKVLSLAITAALAVAGIGVINAAASMGGHFTHDASSPHATIIGTETLPNHKLEFVSGSSEITCDEASYHGVATAQTTESLTITPKWNKCYTTASPETKFDVHENGCTLTFTIGREPESHHTVDVNCPGSGFTITHPNCSIRVPGQTVRGVVYDTVVENGKHAITLTSTVENITTHYEGGICIFLGTNHSATMKGSVTVHGTDTLGNPVNVTATTGPPLG